PEFDESNFAAMVARRYHCRHRVETVAIDDFDLLDRLVEIYDEPYADSSAIPTFRVCELARRSVTVALSGDGGDESFGGYRRYRALEVFRRNAAKANVYDPLSLIQYLDLKTYLVGDINTKVDRASMANSLEVREPLMDHPLVEWLATLPANLKIRDGEGKYLL